MFKKLTRRQTLKTLLNACPIAATIDAFLVEPNLLTTTRKDIFLKKLPKALDGFTIAHLSDFHFQPDKNTSLLKKIVASTNAANPDLIALTGDYVTDRPDTLQPLLEHLSQLKAKHGTVATLGNHDGWCASRALYQKAFAAASIPLLINQNITLDIHGTPLHIAGTDYVWLGAPDAKKTLAGIPADAPVIALVHEPDYFDTMRAIRPIDLQLSGHTHGGQCRVPFIGYAPVKVEFGKNYIYGHYQKDNSQIFVSRGTGTTGLRVRFACTPELALLTLRCAP